MSGIPWSNIQARISSSGHLIQAVILTSRAAHVSAAVMVLSLTAMAASYFLSWIALARARTRSAGFLILDICSSVMAVPGPVPVPWSPTAG